MVATQAILYPMQVKLPNPAKLTEHQIRIATLVACGKSSKQVADDLGISPKTVSVHRAMIYKALGIHGMVELTLYAIRAGWVKVL